MKLLHKTMTLDVHGRKMVLEKNGKLLRKRQYKHHALTVSTEVMITKHDEFQKIMGNFPK